MEKVSLSCQQPEFDSRHANSIAGRHIMWSTFFNSAALSVVPVHFHFRIKCKHNLGQLVDCIAHSVGQDTALLDFFKILYPGDALDLPGLQQLFP